MVIIEVPFSVAGKSVSRRLAEKAAVEHFRRTRRRLGRVVGVVTNHAGYQVVVVPLSLSKEAK